MRRAPVGFLPLVLVLLGSAMVAPAIGEEQSGRHRAASVQVSSLDQGWRPNGTANLLIRELGPPRTESRIPFHWSQAGIDVEFPGEGALELQIEAEGIWSSKASVSETAAAPGSITLFVAPASFLRFDAKVPRGERPPTDFIYRLWPSQERPALTSPGLLGACSVKGSGSDCTLPAGLWDLSLSAEGWTPHYEWRAELRPSRLRDLGSIALRKGGSVSGFAVPSTRTAPEESTKLSLTPIAGQANLGNPTLARRTVETRSTRGGFFQFGAVEQGVYRLVARDKDGGQAVFMPLQVFANRESRLESPLQLARPVDVTLRIHPPQSASGDPWNVTVARFNRINLQYEILADSLVVEFGAVPVRGLLPGSYEVEIRSHTGSFRTVQEVEVAGQQQFIDLDVPLVEVVGRVLVGDEPLECELHFGGAHGAEKSVFQTDAGGEFAGVLARGGRWSVSIVSKDPPLERELSNVEVKSGEDLEIRLAGESIRGVVVDAEGRTAAKIEVRAEGFEDGRAGSKSLTNEEGEFRMRGLSSGHWRVFARGQGQESAQVAQFVPEGGPPPNLRLQLRRFRNVVGFVNGEHGSIPGAVVHLFDPARALIEQAVTSADGRFEIRVSEDAQAAAFIVLPPGHALSVFPRVPLRQEAISLRASAAAGELALTGFGHASSMSPLMLYRSGVPIPIPLLQRWALINGSPSQLQSTSDLRIPRLQPGEYTVCPVEAQTTMNSTPPSNRCRSALVSAGGAARIQIDSADP